MASEDKSLYVPLMEHGNESPRQKKNRIIREFQEVAFNIKDITEKLSPGYLEDVESLPESYIDAIVGSSFSMRTKRHRSIDSLRAFLRKFSDLGEKTKKVVAAQAIKLSKEENIGFIKLTDALVFLHADQLAKKSANYGRIRKFFFYRSQKVALMILMERVQDILTPQGDVANPHLGLQALPGDEFEWYKQACLRIEQLPQHWIAEFYESLRRVETAVEIDKAIRHVISHKDCKGLFPNLTLFFAQTTVRVIFDNTLRSISLKSFQAVVNEPHAVKDLQSFIRCLVDEIETSVFKGKYEDMLELCLVKLMALSDPKEGLNLDPVLLAKCLTIIDNYSLARNRAKFFNHVRDDGYTMLAYIRRAVPSFEKYPKLQPLVPYHDGMNKVAAVLNAMEDEKLIRWVKDGQIDPQKELTATVKDGRFNQKLAERLVRLCGADLDSPDMFSLHHRKEGDLPWENFLFMALQREDLGEPWMFYRSCKAQQGKNINDVLLTVIEFYINCVHWKFGTNLLLGGCYSAIEQLLQDSNAAVTQEMLNKFNVLPQRGESDDVRKKLQKKMNAKQPVEGKGKEEKEADNVPVARIVAASAPAALPGKVAAAESHSPMQPKKSPQELGERLKREIINFVDLNKIQRLLAKGADVTVLGTFTEARQLVYARVSMGKKLEDVKNVCSQLQKAYGALANVPNIDPVTRLRRLVDAEQYEVDINDAVTQAGTAVGQFSIREVRKLAKHRLTQHTYVFALQHVKNGREFEMFCSLRESKEPLLTLIHKACEEENYEKAYVLLRALPDADDEGFLSDTSNFKEILLKLISEEEENERKAPILQTQRKRWAEKIGAMVKTLHNHIYPQAAPASANHKFDYDIVFDSVAGFEEYVQSCSQPVDFQRYFDACVTRFAGMQVWMCEHLISKYPVVVTNEHLKFCIEKWYRLNAVAAIEFLLKHGVVPTREDIALAKEQGQQATNIVEILVECNVGKLKAVLLDERFEPFSAETQVVNAFVHNLDRKTLEWLTPSLKHKLCRCDLTEVTKAELNQHGFGAYLLAGIIYKGGDVSELEKCKTNGVDVHAMDEYGYTALYSAVRFSNDAALNWLVSQGVKPSEKDLAKASVLQSLEGKADQVVLPAVENREQAVLLGKVTSGESAHPVHAKRNSDGAAATVEEEAKSNTPSTSSPSTQNSWQI